MQLSSIPTSYDNRYNAEKVRVLAANSALRGKNTSTQSLLKDDWQVIAFALSHLSNKTVNALGHWMYSGSSKKPNIENMSRVEIADIWLHMHRSHTTRFLDVHLLVRDLQQLELFEDAGSILRLFPYDLEDVDFSEKVSSQCITQDDEQFLINLLSVDVFYDYPEMLRILGGYLQIPRDHLPENIRIREFVSLILRYKNSDCCNTSWCELAEALQEMELYNLVAQIKTNHPKKAVLAIPSHVNAEQIRQVYFSFEVSGVKSGDLKSDKGMASQLRVFHWLNNLTPENMSKYGVGDRVEETHQPLSRCKSKSSADVNNHTRTSHVLSQSKPHATIQSEYRGGANRLQAEQYTSLPRLDFVAVSQFDAASEKPVENTGTSQTKLKKKWSISWRRWTRKGSEENHAESTVALKLSKRKIVVKKRVNEPASTTKALVRANFKDRNLNEQDNETLRSVILKLPNDKNIELIYHLSYLAKQKFGISFLDPETQLLVTTDYCRSLSQLPNVGIKAIKILNEKYNYCSWCDLVDALKQVGCKQNAIELEHTLGVYSERAV